MVIILMFFLHSQSYVFLTTYICYPSFFIMFTMHLLHIIHMPHYNIFVKLHLCKPRLLLYTTLYRHQWLKEHPFSYSTFWCNGMLWCLVSSYILFLFAKNLSIHKKHKISASNLCRPYLESYSLNHPDLFCNQLACIYHRAWCFYSS